MNSDIAIFIRNQDNHILKQMIILKKHLLIFSFQEIPVVRAGTSKTNPN